MKRVEISKVATDDLIAIHAYVARDSHRRADSRVDSLFDACESPGEYPLRGRERSEPQAGIRSLSVGTFVILYRVDVDCVWIVRIVHGAQDLESLKP